MLVSDTTVANQAHGPTCIFLGTRLQRQPAYAGVVPRTTRSMRSRPILLLCTYLHLYLPLLADLNRGSLRDPQKHALNSLATN